MTSREQEIFEEYAKINYKNLTSNIDLTEVKLEYEDKLCKIVQYEI